MKNYMAFYGNDYYPNGGMEDFIGDFETLLDAVDAIVEHNKTENLCEWSCRWAHVYSISERKIIFTK